MRVAVGMSGGVDSSVAALLVTRMGHEAVGVTMRVYCGAGAAGTGAGAVSETPAASAPATVEDPPPAGADVPEPADAAPRADACYGPGEGNDVHDARVVCGRLGIPHIEMDLRSEYRELILEYFKAEYMRGRTPNPCVRCNQLVKFGLLFKKLSDKEGGFDLFATGHYARAAREAGGRVVLRKAVDSRKDQSYFLCMLSQEQLSRSLFPLGGLSKDRVRGIAREEGLPVWDKADSQDFAAGNYREILGAAPGGGAGGSIKDRDGNVLGTHKGIWSYTVGQRRGLGIARGEPLYVTGIDRETGTVFVGPESELFRGRLLASGVNWVSVEKPREPVRVKARIRYRHEEAAATVIPGANDTAEVAFDTPQRSIAAGQWAVFYDGDVLLGGGVIERSW